MAQIANKQNLYAETSVSVGSADYLRLARELKSFEGTVVGVFWDERFFGHETPATLRFEDIVEAWASPTVRVVPLSYNQVRSYSLLFKGKMDILVYPYGSVFPMDALRVYSSQTFNHFLKSGGAVLTTGGLPFMKQAGPECQIMPADTAEEKTRTFDIWAAKFGLKYYELPHPPTLEKADASMLPSLAGVSRLGVGRYGFTIANSSHELIPAPPCGNVFPERYPARQVIPLITGEDGYGAHVSTNAVLVQDFEDGSRRIHLGCEGGNHPLSPPNPRFKPLMAELFTLLTHKVFAVEVEPAYACYRKGEKVEIRSQIVSHEAEERRITVTLEILGEHVETRVLPVKPGLNEAVWVWQPEGTANDELFVELRLGEGQVLSRARNGFVVWDDTKLDRSFRLGLREKYFTFNNQGQYVTGTNYYESTRGEIMWFRPDAARLIEDFRAMHAAGINMIRPHYHHMKWFRDYLLYQHGSLLPYFSRLDSHNSALPDERGWRIFDLFIYLSNKYGIVYNGDLFTLVPEEMGDPRGWFATVEAVYDPEKRAVQKEFLRALERRYAGLPYISWDLFNEPYCIPDEEVNAWARDLSHVFEDMGSDRLLTVGGPMGIGEAVHYDCPHGRMPESYVNDTDRPVLLQELHIDHPEPLEDEMLQAEDLRACCVAAIRSGVAGVCPWSWTRQQRLWQDNYQHHHSFPLEKWDDRLGIHTHEDGTLKIAGQFFKDFAILMRGIDLTGYLVDSRTSTTSHGTLVADIRSAGEGKTYSIHHVNGEQCFCAMQQAEVGWMGKTLLSCDNSAYAYFYARSGSFIDCRELYVKMEYPGGLTVHRKGVASALVVDCLPTVDRILGELEPCETETGIVIDCTADVCRYWIKLCF